MNNKTPNYVQHVFDCLESGTRFKIENGHVTFSNRYYKYTEFKGNVETVLKHLNKTILWYNKNVDIKFCAHDAFL